MCVGKTTMEPDLESQPIHVVWNLRICGVRELGHADDEVIAMAVRLSRACDTSGGLVLHHNCRFPILELHSVQILDMRCRADLNGNLSRRWKSS